MFSRGMRETEGEECLYSLKDDSDILEIPSNYSTCGFSNKGRSYCPLERGDPEIDIYRQDVVNFWRLLADPGQLDFQCSIESDLFMCSDLRSNLDVREIRNFLRQRYLVYSSEYQTSGYVNFKDNDFCVRRMVSYHYWQLFYADSGTLAGIVRTSALGLVGIIMLGLFTL